MLRDGPKTQVQQPGSNIEILRVEKQHHYPEVSGTTSEENGGATELQELSERTDSRNSHERAREEMEDASMPEVLAVIVERLRNSARQSYIFALAVQLYALASEFARRTTAFVSSFQQAAYDADVKCQAAALALGHDDARGQWRVFTLLTARGLCLLQCLQEQVHEQAANAKIALTTSSAQLMHSVTDLSFVSFVSAFKKFLASAVARVCEEYRLLKKFIDKHRSIHSLDRGPEDLAIAMAVCWVVGGLVAAVIFRRRFKRRARLHRRDMPDFDGIFPQIGLGIEFEQPSVPGPILVKRIEAGSTASRSKRIRIGDVVHSIQGVLCHEQTLLDMDDYIMGEPLSQATVALLKPGAPLSALTQPLPQQISVCIKSDYPLRLVSIRRGWVEPAARPASLPAVLPGLLQRQRDALLLFHRLSAAAEKRASLKAARRTVPTSFRASSSARASSVRKQMRSNSTHVPDNTLAGLNQQRAAVEGGSGAEREGGREGGREGHGSEGAREREREGGRERGIDGERDGWLEGGGEGGMEGRRDRQRGLVQESERARGKEVRKRGMGEGERGREQERGQERHRGGGARRDRENESFRDLDQDDLTTLRSALARLPGFCVWTCRFCSRVRGKCRA